MLKPEVLKKIKKTFYTFIVFLIIICVLLIGATFSDINVYWYVQLNKPYHPPFWVYILGWCFLYVLIAISAIIILTKKQTRKTKCPLALPLYLINAVLVSLYSILFFGLRAINLAFIETIFTLASIMLMIWCNSKISKLAAYLLVPYLIWISYTIFLNAMILFSN